METANVTIAQLRPIIFEGKALPPSVMMISLLAPLVAKTDPPLAAWLTSFPNCRATQSAPSMDCFTFSARARDLMLDERETILANVTRFLGPMGADAKTFYAEWFNAFLQISESAARTEDDCEWHAPANPGEAPIVSKQLEAMRRFLGGLE